MGNRCPNCGGVDAPRVARKHGGLGSVYRCDTCALLFRPTGLTGEAITRWYYSFAYGDDPAFTTAPVADPAEALARARRAGKDRAPIVAQLLERLAPAERSVGVLGASWGYELLAFQSLSVPVWGIEPGEARREHGRTAFGLELYADADEASNAGRRGGLLFSSHVLEHIPHLADILDGWRALLQPALSLHITPSVDPFTKDRVTTIGREHPIGVTREFWRRWCAARALDLWLGHTPGHPDGEGQETAAVLGAPGFDLAGLSLRRSA